MAGVGDAVALSAEGARVDDHANRLRVAVVQHGGMFGGAERWQLQLAEASDRIDVALIAIGEGDTSERWGARGVRVRPVRSPRSKWGIPALGAAIWAVLRAERPDVVVAHGVKAALAAVPAARALGVPAVWVRHDPSFTGPLTELLDLLSNGQIATNGWLFEKSRAAHSIVLQPPRMPQGLDRDEARRRLGLEHDGRLILGMGSRFNPNKGIDDAIRALAHPRAGAWSLAIAGIEDPAHPDEPRRLHDLAQSLGVDDRVVYLGNVPELSSVVSAFDAVAVLTKAVGRMSPEAFGMVALEAMTSGVPVIAVPPVSDRLGEGGVAVAADCPDEVGMALGWLTDAPTRRRCSVQASRLAQLHPDAAAVGAAMATFLADLARRPGAGLSPHRAMSVVTTVLDDAEGVDHLLREVRGQLATDDEVVVVDGGSTDGTVDVVRLHATEDSRVRLVVAPGAGISRGRNLGVAAASHDVIACTDAGCLPVPDWLGALRRAIAARPDADLWTGTYRVLSRSAWDRALAVAAYPQVGDRPSPGIALYGRLFGRTFDPSMPTGRSVAFTRAAWQRVGGFPEDLATGEDVTFGRRIVRTGGIAVLAPEAEVAWAQRSTLVSNLRMFMRYGEGSGDSLDPRLLSRDLARAVAYPLGIGILARGGPALRGVASVAAAVYLSVPLARALRGPQPLSTAAMVPPMAAARDISKAAGAVRALARRIRSADDH